MTAIPGYLGYYAAKHGLAAKLSISSAPRVEGGHWMGVETVVNTAADGFAQRVTQAAADVFCVEPAEVYERSADWAQRAGVEAQLLATLSAARDGAPGG